MNLAHVPLRVATGAYILNAGLGKHDADDEKAAGLHKMASGAIPPLGEIEPKPFAKLLSNSEIALGAALLLPIVPSAVAGAALTAFGAGLITLYWRTPGLREPGSARWTQAGTGIAKDVWLLGAGLTLLLDSVARRKR